MRNQDLPKPLPDPVSSDGERGFNVDRSLVAIRVSEDYDGYGSDGIAGTEIEVSQVGPSYRHDDWHVTVPLTKLPMAHDDYADVPVSDIDAWVYTTEERRAMEDTIEHLKKARESVGDVDSFIHRDIKTLVKETKRRRDRDTNHKIVEANGT